MFQTGAMNLPPECIIHSGDRFQALRSLQVEGVVHWNAPLTTGFSGVVPAGTVVVALNDVPPDRTAFYTRPESYAKLEAVLVPERDREVPQYGGYSLVLPIHAIGTDWAPLSEPG
jgi:hypothetical protein